ncbi:lef-5 [Adoxophyes orana granulovirus]|uniref:Late expression factor 5 n=1 Tax=Adoxophyes orana granulovirus TaxID=170617 RepID=Q7T9U2_GVAO|nr:lef-5 [Adoxophyes orana granulovirus]AAP85710.1 lef-5 [Adoxophyes orana granulovirus]AJA91713.1 late expression factor 5 [Adoxophyes orana granulovirus]
MSLDGGPCVSYNNPSLFHLFYLFKEFRNNNDHKGLVDYLICNYPQYVKNRTFNFHNSGHTFHVLYAYIPTPSNKERKQIRLDCMEQLLVNTRNDFKLYEDVIELMQTNSLRESCPCEVIFARLQENIVYNESLKNKNFDTKPCKLKKEPIDAILFKYSINWKKSLNKRKINKNKETKKIKCIKSSGEFVIGVDVNKLVLPTYLCNVNGITLKQCEHSYVVQEKQLRSGDEAVTFLKYCKKCGITVKE